MEITQIVGKWKVIYVNMYYFYGESPWKIPMKGKKMLFYLFFQKHRQKARVYRQLWIQYSICPNCYGFKLRSCLVLLMAEILHQLIGSLSHYL